MDPWVCPIPWQPSLLLLLLDIICVLILKFDSLILCRICQLQWSVVSLLAFTLAFNICCWLLVLLCAILFQPLPGNKGFYLLSWLLIPLMQSSGSYSSHIFKIQSFWVDRILFITLLFSLVFHIRDDLFASAFLVA